MSLILGETLPPPSRKEEKGRGRRVEEDDCVRGGGEAVKCAACE